MENKNIVLYNQFDYYSLTLENILYEIRKINEIHIEFLSGNWDTNIKYRSSFDKNLNDLQPKYYQESGKWIDFIFNTLYFNSEVNSLLTFSTESLYKRKMRLILLFFWRDIISKLNINTIFKLQLKINFTDSIEEGLTPNKILNTDSIHKGTPLIRSIGSVNIYSTNNFYEVLSYFKYHLSEHVDQYLTFPAVDVVLTYNICHEDSILNTINLKHKTFNQLKFNHTKDIMTKNKKKLKIEEKILPLTTDLNKWGAIKLIKGFYPYQFKFKETSLIINTSSNLFNYMVTIKGVFIDGKKIIINRVSVTDKTFKFIFLNFIDIKSDFNPNSFVRIINNNQYVYKDGVKVLSQKRIKAKY